MEMEERYITNKMDTVHDIAAQEREAEDVVEKSRSNFLLVGRQRIVVAGLSWTLRWTLILCCLCVCFVSGGIDARLSSTESSLDTDTNALEAEEQQELITSKSSDDFFAGTTGDLNIKLAKEEEKIIKAQSAVDKQQKIVMAGNGELFLK